MEESLSRSVLKGRPYGGVGILINSGLTKLISHHICKERFVVLVIGEVILINVYLPNVSSDYDLNVVMMILDETENIIAVSQV